MNYSFVCLTLARVSLQSPFITASNSHSLDNIKIAKLSAQHFINTVIRLEQNVNIKLTSSSFRKFLKHPLHISTSRIVVRSRTDIQVSPYIKVSSTVFEDCISQNEPGGALLIQAPDSTVVVDDCTFVRCKAYGSSFFASALSSGGGLALLSNTSNITSCCFLECSGVERGSAFIIATENLGKVTYNHVSALNTQRKSLRVGLIMYISRSRVYGRHMNVSCCEADSSMYHSGYGCIDLDHGYSVIYRSSSPISGYGVAITAQSSFCDIHHLNAINNTLDGAMFSFDSNVIFSECVVVDHVGKHYKAFNTNAKPTLEKCKFDTAFFGDPVSFLDCQFEVKKPVTALIENMRCMDSERFTHKLSQGFSAFETIFLVFSLLY